MAQIARKNARQTGGATSTMQAKWDLGGFEPFNESHAIVMASITIQLASSMDDAAWSVSRKQIFAMAREMELGVPQPYYGMSLTFDSARVGVNINAPSPVMDEVAGLSFTSLDDNDQTLERLVASRDSIIIQTSSYVRWNSFFARAQTFIERLWDSYSKAAKVAFVKSEYWDRFDLSSGSAPDLSKLLRTDGALIASSAIRSDLSWHSQCGYFTIIENDIARLTNTRVDYIDFASRSGEVKKGLVIHTMLQDSEAPQGEGAQRGNAFELESVLAALGSQHAELKNNLGRIITDDAAMRIKL